MPNRLRRIPDGETGDRIYFIQFQKFFFQPAPEMIPEFKMNSELVMHDFTPEQVKAGIDKIKASPCKTKYDDYAIASYQTFKKLRDDGVLPKGIKFQVSMPTHINAIMGFVQRDFQAEIEPIYREALWQAMRNIQDAIPHEDLAFEIDIASEYIFLENISMFRPWFYNDDKDFDKRKEYMYDYIVKQIGLIDQDVEVGLHNCYGIMTFNRSLSSPLTLPRRHATPPLQGARLPRTHCGDRIGNFRPHAPPDQILSMPSATKCHGQAGSLLRAAEEAIAKAARTRHRGLPRRRSRRRP